MKVQILSLTLGAALVLAGCQSKEPAAPVASVAAIPPPPVTSAPLGGAVAAAIGADLDVKDRSAAETAQYEAFANGQRKTWRGPKAYGFVEPGTESTGAGGTCREYSHTIYINGRPRAAKATACRKPDGSWITA